MPMDDLDVLASVLDKDGALLAAVGPGLGTRTTPCTEFDVDALVKHLVGWTQVFAAAANGKTFEGDPTAYASADPAGDFEALATSMVVGWREGGTDRKVRMVGSEIPAQMVLNMTLMEYVTHGCDLALATGQEVPFSDGELSLALERARVTLPDEYRGDGKGFDVAIDVPDSAPALERLLGFMGRRV